MNEPATAKKVKKRRPNPLVRIESLRKILEKQLRRIEASLSGGATQKSVYRHARALELLAQSNLDPRVSISAAKLALERGLFGTNTLLKLVLEGANPEVEKLCALRLIDEFRKPSYVPSLSVGERDSLYRAMLVFPDVLTPEELSHIIRDGAPKARALAGIEVDIRARRADDGDEHECEM